MSELGFAGTLLVPLLCLCTLSLASLAKIPISERRISNIARVSSFSYFCFSAILLASWLFSSNQGAIKWDVGPVALFLDRAGVVFLGVTSILANIIILFSRRYLHRDPGFRRFYLVLSLFLFGMTLLFCAGSFDVIFAAWEIIGLSSFLLIGFYWHRPSAVINAKRAYFIYRACDVGLLASALISHLVWHAPNLFYDLGRAEMLFAWKHVPLFEQWMLSVLILLPVIGKSAQFPVSYWLPKAMEGPTPSSAIFYGSISIHAGVFLLIRTSSIWYHTPGFVWALGIVGGGTAICATLFGRVQATIKGQIGYASIAQVGLMLVELSFGLIDIVLIHFVGNAFLRCFQLLVSSSVIADQLHMHTALDGKVPTRKWSIENCVPKSLRTTLYVFAINEGFCESLINVIVVKNATRIARLCNNTLKLWDMRSTAPASVTLRSNAWFPMVAILLYTCNVMLGETQWIPGAFLGLSVFLSFSAFGEKKNPLTIIRVVAFSHLACLGALSINHIDVQPWAVFYLAGFGAAWFIVHDAYSYVLKRHIIQEIERFEGLFARFPLASMVGLIGILGLVGFPFATTFYAEDLLLEHAVTVGIAYVLVPSLIFIVNGTTLVRLHSRLFFGSREFEASQLDLDYSSAHAASLLLFFFLTNLVAFTLI